MQGVKETRLLALDQALVEGRGLPSEQQHGQELQTDDVLRVRRQVRRIHAQIVPALGRLATALRTGECQFGLYSSFNPIARTRAPQRFLR